MISARAKQLSKSYIDAERAQFAAININHLHIADELDPFYEFKNKDVYWDYMNHRTKRLSFHTLSLILLFIIFYGVPSELTALISDINSGSSSLHFGPRLFISISSFIMCSMMLTFAIIIFWIKLSYTRKCQISIHSELDIHVDTKNPSIYSTVFSFCTNTYFILLFMRRSLSFSCLAFDSIFVLASGDKFCYEQEDTDLAISIEAAFLFLSLLTTFVAVPNISVKVLWLNFSLSVAAILFVGCYTNTIFSVILRVVFVFIFVASAIADLQYSGILDYLYSREVVRLHETLHSMKAETELLFKEEMRVLIGNVAHDIKSVSLPSFDIKKLKQNLTCLFFVSIAFFNIIYYCYRLF
jgi:hypothetical protein